MTGTLHESAYTACTVHVNYPVVLLLLNMLLVLSPKILNASLPVQEEIFSKKVLPDEKGLEEEIYNLV